MLLRVNKFTHGKDSATLVLAPYCPRQSLGHPSATAGLNDHHGEAPFWSCLVHSAFPPEKVKTQSPTCQNMPVLCKTPRRVSLKIELAGRTGLRAVATRWQPKESMGVSWPPQSACVSLVMPIPGMGLVLHSNSQSRMLPLLYCLH